MLTPELVDALQAPISEASPCGDDLEYDPAFMALEASAQGKAEQQFGDTVIPAVEPDWRAVSEEAEALLRRAKDLRPAVLLLRASTRMQGVAGLTLGLQLITGLLDKFWADLHPKLDTDDDNDPTMRLNALAPLGDEGMLLRDLYEARVGMARGVGPIRVRDIAVAYNQLAAIGGEATYTQAQVNGGLEEIRTESPAVAQLLLDVSARVAQLQALIVERTGRSDAIDFGRLRGIGATLAQACKAIGGVPTPAGEEETAPGTTEASAPRATAAAPRGEIASRQDAVQTLDRVIRYLQQAEPGNPAPLLIERAKQLIGVDFFQIMANLAPNALETIETVTGKRSSE